MEATTKRIESLLSIVQPVYDNLIQKDLGFPTEFMATHVLERLIQSLVALRRFIENWDDDFDHSLGLLIRNIASDLIHVLYITQKASQNEEREELLFCLLHQDIEKGKNHLKRLIKHGLADESDHRFIDEDKFVKLIRNFRESRKLKKIPQIAQMVDEIFENPDAEYPEYALRLYDFWALYSKYEHLGWFSYKWSRGGNKPRAIKGVDQAIRYAGILSTLCLDWLGETKLLRKVIDATESD